MDYYRCNQIVVVYQKYYQPKLASIQIIGREEMSYYTGLSDGEEIDFKFILMPLHAIYLNFNLFMGFETFQYVILYNFLTSMIIT